MSDTKDRDETLAVYNAKASEYAGLTVNKSDHESLVAFVADLPANSHVLDFGCGPGHFAAEMVRRGCKVDAFDGSAEMVTLAAQHTGVNAWQAYFEDLDANEAYDGVWASFSLLHAPREDLPAHLARIKRVLKPAGVFHIGMKLGDGAARDTIGRQYTYVTEDELMQLLQDAGFTPYLTQKGRGRGLSGSVDPFILVRSHA
ncbi:class I SAM-dependent methyltransferase [Lentibacter algarum]|uniref:class I SAM-dependent methyltransferase n=1 Tax=Lentibacter algarum TaxID=576131 RepID=UPI001C076B35|nr:class I SAM-dependent methyltransferase [Lentibacter algarum]MBU2981747.1 class I SAM-dependent methyltransferase [Lentibacter algarum]